MSRVESTARQDWRRGAVVALALVAPLALLGRSSWGGALRIGLALQGWAGQHVTSPKLTALLLTASSTWLGAMFFVGGTLVVLGWLAPALSVASAGLALGLGRSAAKQSPRGASTGRPLWLLVVLSLACAAVLLTDPGWKRRQAADGPPRPAASGAADRTR